MSEEPTMDDLIIALPLVQKVPVVALKNLFGQREKLDIDQQEQVQKIQKKYAELIKPYLERASQLIQGKDPLPDEASKINQYLKTGQKAPQLKGKIIENYWNSALENSQVAHYITEQDEKALEYLLDIQVVDGGSDNANGINIRFIFKNNPYFTETSVVRRLKYSDGKSVCLEGDLVSWKQGAWLTHASKKVNNKSTGEAKVIQGKKIESFFDIFLNWTETDNPTELQKSNQILRQLLEVIKDSLSYFLGLFEVEGASDDEEEDYDDEQEQQEQLPKKGKKK